MDEKEVFRYLQEKKLDALHNRFRTIEEMCKWKYKKTGDTLAILACRFGNVELLQELTAYDEDANTLCCDAKWDAPNFEAKRPLHEAAQQGNEECVEVLLRTGKVNVNATKRAEWTPLHLACTRPDNLAVCRKLLDAGASTSMKNKDGWNALHIAARDSSCDVLALLFERDPLCAVTKSGNGRTPLHTCALNGCEQNLRFLLQVYTTGRCELPSNVTESVSELQAIDPVRLGSSNSISLQHIDAVDSCGSTPLADAVRGDHVAIAALLVQHGASLSTRDSLKRSLLHIAAETGSVNSIEWLLSKLNTATGTSSVDEQSRPFCVNERCGSPLCMTPLHFAAREGHRDVLQLLIKHGGDVNVCDAKGRAVNDYIRDV